MGYLRNFLQKSRVLWLSVSEVSSHWPKAKSTWPLKAGYLDCIDPRWQATIKTSFWKSHAKKQEARNPLPILL